MNNLAPQCPKGLSHCIECEDWLDDIETCGYDWFHDKIKHKRIKNENEDVL